MRNKVLSIILSSTLFILGIFTGVNAQAKIETATEYEVSEIIDGDTIKLKVGENSQILNLLLVDTPELKHNGKDIAMGKYAKEFTTKFLKDKSVIVELDKITKDKDGTPLAYIYIKDNKRNDICINEKLIKNGYAKVAEYETDTIKYDEFKDLETKAMENNLNIWKNIEQNYPTIEVEESKEYMQSKLTELSKAIKEENISWDTDENDNMYGFRENGEKIIYDKKTKNISTTDKTGTQYTFEKSGKYTIKSVTGQKTDVTNKSNKKNNTSSKNTGGKKEYIADTTSVVVKGNKRTGIYHLPGGASYNRISTKNVVYFNSEAEAKQAGYRPAKR